MVSGSVATFILDLRPFLASTPSNLRLVVRLVVVSVSLGVPVSIFVCSAASAYFVDCKILKKVVACQWYNYTTIGAWPLRKHRYKFWQSKLLSRSVETFLS